MIISIYEINIYIWIYMKIIIVCLMASIKVIIWSNNQWAKICGNEEKEIFCIIKTLYVIRERKRIEERRESMKAREREAIYNNISVSLPLSNGNNGKWVNEKKCEKQCVMKYVNMKRREKEEKSYVM